MELLKREAEEVRRQQSAEWVLNNKEKMAKKKAVWESTKRKKRTKRVRASAKEEDLFHDPLEVKEKYGCSICGEVFTKLGHRDLHELQVHSSDGWVQRAECGECDKSYSNKENLNRHMSNEHHELREYQCEDCPGKFARDDLLDYRCIVFNFFVPRISGNILFTFYLHFLFHFN